MWSRLSLRAPENRQACRGGWLSCGATVYARRRRSRSRWYAAVQRGSGNEPRHAILSAFPCSLAQKEAVLDRTLRLCHRFRNPQEKPRPLGYRRPMRAGPRGIPELPLPRDADPIPSPTIHKRTASPLWSRASVRRTPVRRSGIATAGLFRDTSPWMGLVQRGRTRWKGLYTHGVRLWTRISGPTNASTIASAMNG